MSTPAGPKIKHRVILPIEFQDESNPRAIINLLPKKFGERVREVRASHPQYFNKDDGELYQYLKTMENTPRANDDMLRMKFWLEYERVQAFMLDSINLTQVCGGICSIEYFTGFYLRAPDRVAWLMCPPVEYMVRLEEMHTEGLRALSDILRKPHEGPGGKLDYKMIDTKIKIFNLVNQRLMGSIVQKSESKQLNVNVDARDAKDVLAQVTGNNQEALENRLRELELQDARLANQPHNPAQIPMEQDPSFNMSGEDV